MKRIQRSRAAGWRMPENCVYVGRPTIYGNPWVGRDAVAAYRRFIEQVYSGVLSLAVIEDGLDASLVFWKPIKDWHELRGLILPRQQLTFDVACWCPLSRPCHADVLIEWATKKPKYTNGQKRHEAMLRAYQSHFPGPFKMEVVAAWAETQYLLPIPTRGESDLTAILWERKLEQATK